MVERIGRDPARNPRMFQGDIGQVCPCLPQLAWSVLLGKEALFPVSTNYRYSDVQKV